MPQLYISLFANTGAVAINKAKTTCVIVLGMRKVANLRNVKEIDVHVNYVDALLV